MKKCKYCRSEIDKKAKICPVCGKRLKGSAGMIIGLILVVVVFVGIIAAVGGDDAGGNTAYDTQRVLLDADNVKVTFLKAYEESYIEGAHYLQLDVENKFDSRVMVMLENPVVNGYSTLTLSGIPMEIEPGSSNKTPFFYNENNIGMEKLEDLRTIEFNVCVYDAETMAQLYSSDKITIEF